MRNMLNKMLMIALALPFASIALGDSIMMKDGRQYDRVVFLSGSSRSGTIVIRDRRGNLRRLSIQDVASIQFGDVEGNGYALPHGEAPPPANYQQPYGYQQQGSQHQEGAQAQPTNEQRAAVPVATMLIPAGTEINVHTSDKIDSKFAQDDQVFYATVNRGVADDRGNIAIPQGSQAELVIRHGARGTASEYLLLDMDAVSVNGSRYWVTSNDIPAGSRQGPGANHRTAEMVGGGALLGSVIGAMAGGGKGAAIGALAGAGAGAGAEVITKGSEVRVPAESILTFRLDRDLVLQPPQG